MFRRLVTAVRRRVRSHRIAVTVTLVALGVFVVTTPIWTAWLPSLTGSPVRLVRFAAPFPAMTDPLIAAAITNSQWTAYADYQTIHLGRLERPARLFTGRKHWDREVTVPRGGARWEMVLGVADAPATVRTGRRGAAPSETRAVPGEWTQIAIDLDSADGSTQFVAVDVDVAAGGVAAWSAERVTPLRRQQNPPDVILISLDTVRRDRLTPYNRGLATTPVLDAFARNALRFDQAVSTSSWTVASHATLFTGHFPADSLGYQAGLPPGELTLAEIFAARGYQTFGVSGGPFTEPRWGLHQGFDQYVVSGDRENAREATSRAIEWMDASRDNPAFVFLNYFNAHEPLVLSPGVRQATGVTDDVSSDMWHAIDDRRSPITPAVRQRLLAAYGAELSAIDTELGRLFEHLQRTGRWDSALVIVWADHGQLLGERGNIGHAYSLDEELLRVPLIIKAPDAEGLRPGVYRHPIQNDDLFALCQTLDGMSSREGDAIAAAIRADLPFRRVSYAKLHHDPLPILVAHPRWRSATQWAASDGRMKIVADLEGRSTAFDLSGPEERPAPMPQAGSELTLALERFRRWSGNMTGWGSNASPLSPAETERLRALGYLR
jgi:hypothetical protein